MYAGTVWAMQIEPCDALMVNNALLVSISWAHLIPTMFLIINQPNKLENIAGYSFAFRVYNESVTVL